MIRKLIIQTWDLPNTNITTAKLGDIIDVVDDSFVGGTVERRTHLIIRIDLGNWILPADNNLEKFLRIERWTGDPLWWPPDGAGFFITQKRRYQIPWNELITKAQTLFGITVDMNRVLDENDEYQPLENVVFPIIDLVRDKVLSTKVGLVQLNNIKIARQSLTG